MQTSPPSPRSPLSASGRPKVGVAIGGRWSASVLDIDTRTELEQRAALVDLDLRAPDDSELAGLTGLISGWGTPRLDAALLERLPDLTVVCHAAGSIRGLVSEELWARGIRITSAAGVNAGPVVDYTIAQIVLALKNAWRLGHRAKTEQVVAREAVPGVHRAAVGLVGLGRIGRMLAARLQQMGITVLAHDPHVTAVEAERLGLQLHSLPELAARSEVLSVHAPLIYPDSATLRVDATAGMITAEVLDRMPAGATLINTARGALIVTDDLTRFLQRRPDVYALLDVTDPEPLPAGHPLLTLPNAFVTPHIAGSLGREVALLGRHAAEQLTSYLEDGTLTDEVVEEDLATAA